MISENLRNFISEKKEQYKNTPDILKIIEEIESGTSQDSRIVGTLMILALCENRKL